MKRNIVPRYLSKCFRQLGKTITLSPGYFILLPLFISLLLSTGLQRLKEDNDIEYLTTPDEARTTREKLRINTLFPKQNTTNFFLGREIESLPGGSVIITSADGKSVLRKGVFKEVLLVDELIRNVSITAEDRQWKYKDLCRKSNGKCLVNNVLTLSEKLEDAISGSNTVKYPISFTENGQKFEYFGNSLGGVSLDEDSYVTSAKAIRLFYVLDGDTDWNRRLARKWESAFLDFVESAHFSKLTVNGIAISSTERELNNLLPRVISLFPLSMVAMFIFSAVTCLREDWIQSKPWTGMIAATSAGLALSSGFGLMIYCGVTFSVTLAPIPFVILGIAMDDTFVLLAAWRRTDPKKGLTERMGQSYEESSISITITSLTNFIAFISGVFAPLPFLRIFSLYAATCVFFSYIYQITFIGGCMSICCHAEEQNKHSVTFLRTKSPKGCFPTVNLNVWLLLGDVLTKWPVKIVSIILMASYMAVGIYGVTKLKYLDDMRDIAPYNSNLVQFVDKQYEFFDRYGVTVQIIVDQELDYANTTVQSQMEQFLSQIESSTYMSGPSLTESWLRHYLSFLNDERTRDIIRSYNVSNTKDFIEILRRIFLHIPAAKRFQQDITFDDTYSSIIGSRFICRSGVINSQEDHYYATRNLREIASESSFRTFPYHFTNFEVDEVDTMNQVAVQTLIAVTVAIFVVCLLIIPDFVTVICVMCSVISEEVCVLGYMALWNIPLAPIPTVIVVASAGFAVDYAAHVTYAYSISDGQSQNERMRNSIAYVGMAIFQGYATTIISILPLMYPIATSLVTALKIVFMMASFSAVHALVFLPVVLSSIHFLNWNCFKKWTANMTLADTRNLSVTGNTNYGFKENSV